MLVARNRIRLGAHLRKRDIQTPAKAAGRNAFFTEIRTREVGPG